MIDFYNRADLGRVAVLVRGESTVADAQHDPLPGRLDQLRYMFSIWAFPEERYVDALRAYFEFSQEYYQRTGYRINLLSVGYRILEDQSSLFSYTFHGRS